MATRMQQRRGTAAQWTGANPILNVGEIGYETDTNQFKIGDGTNHWADLAYFVDEASLNTALGDYIETSQLGVANGVATLNASGKLESSQVPNIDELAQDAVDMALVAGTGITKSYSDNANTITIAVDTSVVATKAELAEVSQDSVANAILSGTHTNISVSYNDNDGTISFTAAPGYSDEQAQDAIGNNLGFGLSYNDNTGSVSVDTSTVQARVANVSDSEIGYLANVTSDIQSQIDSKANLSGATFTGDVSGTNLTLSGNLIVNGTTTNINSVNLVVEDKNVVLGDTASPTDASADGGGITLKGTTDKTLAWNDATDSWTSSENVNLASGKTVKINSVDVLTSSQVLGKSLPSGAVVGTSDTQTLTGKTISADNNTLSGIAASSFVISDSSGNIDGAAAQKAIPTGNVVGTSDEQTLSNKTLTAPIISTITNTGTITLPTSTDTLVARNTTDTLANKTINFACNTVSGTISQFNSALSDADFATLQGIETLTGKTINLSNNTVSGTVDQFNAALSDGNFITSSDSGTVTSTMIADGTIVNGDINASAAIALSKLATDPLARANHTGTQTASTISDFDTQVRTSRLDQMAAPIAKVSLNSQQITNLASPTADGDAATKAYVDAATAGLNVHASVKAATTVNITLASAVENGDVLDGVTLSTGDRILVKNQTTKADNGVYVVAASGAPTRATDYDSTPEVDAGDFIFIEGGTVNGKTGWVQTNLISTVGTDAIEFTQFAGAGTYAAGNGLTLTGSTFSINTGTTVDLNTAQVLTNKTISLASNSVSGTLAQFNSSVTDADLASIGGTETLFNKTVNLANNTVTGTVAEFNTALSDANFITTTDSGTVTSAMIADGAIVNADINASAAIALSKLATDPLARANHTGTQLANTISNFDTQVRTNRLDQMAAPTADVSLNSRKITSLGTPTADTDAATKLYTDGLVQARDAKASVQLAFNTNQSLTSNLGTRVLLFGQSTQSQNGIYGWSGSSMVRTIDALPGHDNGGNPTTLTVGATVFVEGGTFAGRGYVATTVSGVGGVIWTQFAGDGLTLTAPRFASAGEIDDANGNELIKFPSTVASAVNEITVTNAATGNNPSISATGDNTDISLNLVPKGAGTVQANGVPVVTTSGTQTLTNKTINLANNTVTGTVAQFNTALSDANFITTTDSGTVTSTMIADGTIVNADINASAAIAQSKIDGLSTSLAAKADLAGATFTGAISGTDLTLSGNLIVNGTTTNLNSTNLVIEDKNIVLGDTTTPTNTTADGGGITLKGATDKTLNWVDATSAWTSSEDFNLVSGKSYEINGTIVLSSTQVLGKSLPTGDVIGTSDTQTLTNKSINLANNTVTGTVAQFNTALSDGDFATIAGTETLTNKTLANAVVTGTVTAGGGVGSSGQYLESTGTGVRWTTVSGYSAPTIGSTSIASGATVTTIAGLTLTTARPQLTMNAQTATTYTLALADASSRWVTCDNAGAITVTVPPSVFATGDTISIQQIGAGQVTFAQGSGVTITSAGATSSAPRIRTRFASATVICTGTNTFTVVGDIV